MQYAECDARAQAAVLLAVGRAAHRNAVMMAYACEVIAGRTTDSNFGIASRNSGGRIRERAQDPSFFYVLTIAQ
jgi:hypothetical protein